MHFLKNMKIKKGWKIKLFKGTILSISSCHSISWALLLLSLVIIVPTFSILALFWIMRLISEIELFCRRTNNGSVIFKKNGIVQCNELTIDVINMIACHLSCQNTLAFHVLFVGMRASCRSLSSSSSPNHPT